jgi:hypothetical protein
MGRNPVQKTRLRRYGYPPARWNVSDYVYRPELLKEKTKEKSRLRNQAGLFARINGRKLNLFKKIGKIVGKLCKNYRKTVEKFGGK